MTLRVTTTAPKPPPEALRPLAETQPALASAFAAGWDLPAQAWAQMQWAPPEDPHFEPAFRRALVEELAPQHGNGADALVASVEATGGVLTAHHVCPTPGPTFGAIDRLACLGQPGPVLVLAWSGVPMSNSACSGALCFSAADYEDLLVEGPQLSQQRKAGRDRERDGVTERRVSLVSAAMRDALLYECALPKRLLEVMGQATPGLREVLPAPVEEESYAAWCVRAAQALQRRVLGRDNLHYVDLNRVARRYLLDVLEEPTHPITRLLGRPCEARPQSGRASWFYGRRAGKREKVLTLDAPPDDAREGLADGRYCPGLVPVFGALRLLSRMRLFGSFRQVLYLEEIARAFLAAAIVQRDRGVPGRMMTGRLTDGGAALYPLDLALGRANPGALPDGDTPMSTLWGPLVERVQSRT